MKIRLKNIWKHLAAVVLGLLGFASCGEEIEPLAMYGSPHADFKALGTVEDEAGKPIEGIRVAIRRDFGKDYYENDTIYTDKKGDYLLTKYNTLRPSGLLIVFEDVDGAGNGGEFKSAEARPEIKQTGEGDKAWYQGLYEAKADVVLKKK